MSLREAEQSEATKQPHEILSPILGIVEPAPLDNGGIPPRNDNLFF